MPTDGPHIHCIGPLTLNLAAGRLIGPAGDVEIRPKTFAMLACLARNAGQIVTKDDMMSAIWPDVVVSEDSLTQCVHDLRRILGPGHQDLLRTFPRRGYMLETAGPVMAFTDAPTNRVPEGSIAILPFAPQPGASAREGLLFDALAHDTISGLARLRCFHVSGRGSAFALRGLAGDPRRLRHLLGVSYVVTGYILTTQTGLRLHLDLVRTDQGTLVWTEAFPLRLDQINQMAETISQSCISAIASAVTLSERQRAAALREQPLSAWETLHSGLNLIFRFEPQAMAQALALFTAARALDPGCTRAAAFQSFCHYHFAFAGIAPDRKASLAACLGTATDAMNIDDNNPVAHWAYGRARYLAGDPDDALKHCAKAVELCPSFPHAHYMLGFIQTSCGSPSQAFADLDRSEALSPVDPFNASIQLNRARLHLRLGQLDKAADFAIRVVRHQNSYSQMLYHSALILAAAEQDTEGKAAMRRAFDLTPGFEPENVFRAVYGMSQEEREALKRGQQRLQAV